MIPYSSRSGKKSGVIGYEIGEDSIAVQFDKGDVYLYTNNSCGSSIISRMKNLAINQQGLATFISRTKPQPQSKF